ncbi:tyrosine recombinase XerD [Actinoplanes sp. SE50]|uniref:tyrosine-type recombinase/integrase n=1 Tax=unclassified Actinoplanes TaxID=2626549 RepID=UPI00023EDE09|nr:MULTISPECIES: tyrosine-type recombinase/integrase [unclassified Actinoplanes]AEV88687.1 Tyrosine recombinase xerD [Actinoplanes sp. SE50/110]ATO87091.1 tyrosine recombinase XerD [Actinoplanes sp. SE50]SLM04509.1 hypothetical protein ACSP50_7815 [Actinoplanes sp. SE50/110]
MGYLATAQEGASGSEAGVPPLFQIAEVRQQLQFHSPVYVGFYLKPPKAGSVGDVDLDDQVAIVIAEHIRKHPPVNVQLPDITEGAPDQGRPPTRRAVPLLFTSEQGLPIHDKAWAKLWTQWRKAAEGPAAGTFHSLRHFFATTLIDQAVEPTEVQKALRHASLKLTLETYVHWWPKQDRRRSVISTMLKRFAETNRKAVGG